MTCIPEASTTHCNKLQYTATHHNTQHHAYMYIYMMCVPEASTTHCNKLQYTATNHNTQHQVPEGIWGGYD